MLEFHRTREILSGFTSFSLSRELALNLQPLSDYEQVALLLKQSAEARTLLSLEPEFSVGEVVDIRQSVKLATRGKILTPQTLVEIERTLASVRQLRRSLVNLSSELPLIWNISSSLVEFPQLEKDIRSCLMPTGELLDSASPRLATVRQQLKQTRQQLLDRLESLVRSPRGQRIIQEPIITEREGRYVIPVKVESRKEIKGIVHDVSNTGATVFVEPWTTIELGNKLRELTIEEEREIERILRDLSAEVGEHAPEISNNISLTAELDLALAKARYARKFNATEPALVAPVKNARGTSAQTVMLKLADARHPLLGDKAVPLSIEIGRDFSALVITGPNTGGKTVALKTIGLLTLMTQAGIPIPASADSSLPVFDGVFADIGDEQSIEQTLSTFSWHMGNIIRIIRSATHMSLVLLDELGTSTDPAEGSALARSVLLHFLSKPTITVATTHYSDLKAFAHVTPGLQNASLDFDPVTLTPTYHLTVGIPGGSNALATASRLGLNPHIVSRAREMLSKGTQELETLLGDLMSERNRTQALRRDLEIERREVEQRNTELEKELQQLKAQERTIIQESRDRVVREAAALQKEIRQAASQLRKKTTKEGLEQTRKTLAKAQEQLRSGDWQAKVDSKKAEHYDSNVNTGDTVWLKEAHVPATVLSVSEETQQVEVQAGATRITLRLDGVEKIAPSSSQDAPGYIPPTSTPRAQVVLPELHLRGRRADEVEWALDSYLDSAYLVGLNEVRIVHGRGTGVLRSIVRELLAYHPLVKSFRPGGRGEGGDGVTIARLESGDTAC